ncbi:MAG: arginine deiminase family protein [Chloroflexota bacterium]
MKGNMMKHYGSQSMVSDLKLVLLKHPQHSHLSQHNMDAQWQSLFYPERQDFDTVQREYAQFVDLLASFGRESDLEIMTLPEDHQVGLDSIYTHDPLVISNSGVILCNMGKAARDNEPTVAAAFLHQIGVPIVGEITGEGILEGGDVLWLEERIVAVGEGYRTNAEGIRQLTALLGDDVDEVIFVPLPHWTGPDDCLHLLSFISPVDHKKAVVYSKMMPVPFRQRLLSMGWTLIEVPDAEYDSMATNVLAVTPGRCIMLSGNPITEQRLMDAGVEVVTYEGADLCLKGGGGPTCLTRPIWRE